MHLTSLVCFKMSTICNEESSKVCKRKKTRRGKRYRTEEEKRRVINEYMKQRKHRVAPSNTTQFIIEDREKVEPILDLSPRASLSGLSSPEGDADLEFELNLSEEDIFNEEFFVKDFETTYRQMCRENLYALPKSELVEKVKELECQKDVLERERRCCVEGSNDENTNEPTSLKYEFEQLQQQNNLLREENKKLRKSKDEQMTPE